MLESKSLRNLKENYVNCPERESLMLNENTNKEVDSKIEGIK